MVPCLKDNYAFILFDSFSGCTAVVDTPDPIPIENELKKRGWGLTHIFNTHHHEDHTGGNLYLKTAYPACEIIGPTLEKTLIPGVDVCYHGGDKFIWGESEVQVIDVAGHTKGQIAYHFPTQKMVFVGDSLFALGCGRLFEGSAKQAYDSLQRISALDEQTKVYCAHEYTESNARFAETIEGELGTNSNPDLTKRIKEVHSLRAQNIPTVPTTVGLEKKTNPFLRIAQVRTALKLNNNSNEDVFAELRRRKDSF